MVEAIGDGTAAEFMTPINRALAKLNIAPIEQTYAGGIGFGTGGWSGFGGAVLNGVGNWVGSLGRRG